MDTKQFNSDETTAQKIKRESTGYSLLDKKREEKERQESLGIWMRIAAKYGEITAREEASMNI